MNDATDNTTSNTTNSASILVVDDDPMNCFLMTEALAIDNHRSIEADSGEKALALFIAHQPDLVLLDIDMPGMDGLATCRAIRAHPTGKLVPIVMVTGLDSTTAVDAAFDSGATDFLAKPLNWTLMRQRVRFMLRHNAITQTLARNEQVLKQTQAMARVGHWEWDLKTNVIHVAARARDMFPDLVPLYENAGLKLGSSTSSETPVLAAIQSAIAKREQSLSDEFDIKRPGGGFLHMLVHIRIDYEGETPVYILGSAQDITERYLNEERYTSIFNNSPVGIIETSSASQQAEIVSRIQRDVSPEEALRLDEELAQTITSTSLLRLPPGSRLNAAALRMLDIDNADAEIADYFEFALSCNRAGIKAARQNLSEAVLQHNIQHADGSIHPVIVRIPFIQNDHHKQHIILTLTDVSELMAQQSQLRRADKIIENSHDAIAQFDRHQNLLSANPAHEQLHGYSLDELRKIDPRSLITFEDDTTTALTVKAHAEREGFWRGEAYAVNREGKLTPLLVSLSPVFNDQGELTGYVTVSTDITPLKESERRLSQLAHYDALTQLPNRLSLKEGLAQELIHAQTDQSLRALLYIDLDGFKLVNDSLGHTTGDALLAQVARRLEAVSSPGDLLARIGGDEFALLMRSPSTREEIALHAHQILTSLQEPFHLDGRELHVGASIGACLYPDDATSAVGMLRNADSAMYEAKRLGRNQLCFYSSYLTEESSRRLTTENELRTGIQSGQLFLLYQPKYDANSGAMLGAEALVRWQSPTRGVVPPNDFIGIAEETGLIIALGEWVIHEACRQIAAWRREHGVNLPIAINISALHLYQQSLLQVLADAIHRYDISPSLLEIEITEDSLDFRGRNNVPYDILHSLSAMGLSIAIDDFGTGYSSLSQLKNMPISTLKIDRSFVRDIAVDPSDYAIITAIVGLAKTLDMRIVAEGVETEEQAEKLRALECNVFQGFLYSKPIAASDLIAQYLARHLER